MKKYFCLFKTQLATGFEYRANLIGTICMELLSIGNVIIVWIAIFRSQQEVRGFTAHSAILYYLLIPLFGFITSVTISDSLSSEIRSGDFSNHLIKPYNLALVNFAKTLAQKVNTLIITIPMYVIISIVFMQVADVHFFSFKSIGAAIVISFAAFLMHFILDLAISWLAFWVTDIWSFRHFKLILFSVFGGLAFPFELVSDSFRAVLEKLPFQYFYYVPTSYLTGKRTTNLLSDILILCIWSSTFGIIGFTLWKLGLKKYGAYGN